jgi:hypothetical protein
MMHKALRDWCAHATKPAPMTNVPIAIFLLGAQFLGFPSSPFVKCKCTEGVERCPIIILPGTFSASPSCGAVTCSPTEAYIVASEEAEAFSTAVSAILDNKGEKDQLCRIRLTRIKRDGKTGDTDILKNVPSSPFIPHGCNTAPVVGSLH